MGFFRQEYWSGMPPPGDLPDRGIEPKSLMSPASAGGFFTASVTWEAGCGQSVAPQKLTYAVASGHSWWEVLIEENRYSDPYSGNLSLMRFPIPFLLKSSPYLSIKAWASQSLVTKSMLVQSPSAFCLYKSGTQRFERDCSRLPLSHYLNVQSV